MSLDDPEAAENWKSGFVHDDAVVQRIAYWVGVGTYLVLARIDQMEKHVMSDLTEVLSDIAVLEGESGQIITDLQDVEAQLAALQASGLTPEQQAQVDEIHTRVSAVNSAIQAALPATPPPTP